MSAEESSAESLQARAVHLHRSATVWDNHVCLPLRAEPQWADQLKRHRDAGATFISLNLGDADVPLDTIVRMAAHFRGWVRNNPRDYLLAERASDVLRAKEEGRTAVAFDIEGAQAIGDQLSLVELFYEMGVRWILLAFNRGNRVGGGCHDAEDAGLTPFGAQLLDEFERVGMVTCCSHTGHRTALEVLDRARGPVIFSHSNAQAIFNHPRNLPDEIIRRCAATGGVVGVNGLHIFLGNREDLLGQFVNHIDHMVQLVGPRHVGIGLDYVYDQETLFRELQAAQGIWPPGYGYGPGILFLEPEALPKVTERLLARGYDEGDVRAILGGNFLRVAQNVWR